MNRKFVALVTTLAALLPSGAALAKEGDVLAEPTPKWPRGRDKELSAVRATSPVVIDGRLDDAAWQAAPVGRDFVQVQPEDGKAPTEKTEFKIMYDDENLYIGVHCHDSNPEGIVTRLTRRDRDIEADWVAVTIDSKHDRQSGYTFQLSSAGVQVDGQFYADFQFSYEWDAVWQGQVTRDSTGWIAEMAVPLTMLRFSSQDRQTWGVQVHRNVSRKREQMLWAWESGGNQFGASRFGQLTDLVGLRPRRTLEIRPYIMGRSEARTSSGGSFLGLSSGSDHDVTVEGGVDLKVGLTSRLTLDASFNPDFGQVEADQVVLNLTRFETFFPEKRPFFLEGRDIFETPVAMFYARRIGRPAVGLRRGETFDLGGESYVVRSSPSILRLWTAAKVTGEVADGWAVGALTTLTGAETVEAQENSQGNRDLRDVEVATERLYSVGRVRYDLGNSSYVGATATSVTRIDGTIPLRATADHDAYAQALDFRYLTPAGLLRTWGQLLLSERVGGPDVTRSDGTRLGDGSVGVGGMVKSEYRTTTRLARVEYYGYSPELEINDAGFLTQFNEHELKLVGGFNDRTPGKYFNNIGIFPFGAAAMTMDGTPSHSYIGFDLEYNTRGFTFGSPEQWFNLPGNYDIYETFDGARFEKVPGFQGHIETNTNPARMVQGFVSGDWAIGLADGEYQVGGEFGVNVQAASNIELTLAPGAGSEKRVRFIECNGERACDPDGGMHSYLFAGEDSKYLTLTLRGTYTARPDLSAQFYMQWFGADVDYADYQTVTTMGFEPTIDRDDLTDVTFAPGERDGDNFEFASLNLNFVLRWELIPGSVLYMVYTRANESQLFEPGRLHDGPAEDVVLFKLQYFGAPG